MKHISSENTLPFSFFMKQGETVPVEWEKDFLV